MADQTASKVTFRRVVSPALAAALAEGGALAWLLARLKSAAPLVDVQLPSGGGRSWVTAYFGLTSVLDLYESNGTFHLTAHETHQGAGAFSPQWAVAQTSASLTAQRAEIEGYIDRILAAGGVDERYTGCEGRVQSLMSARTHTEFGVVQREAVLAFSSKPVRESLALPFRQRIWQAAARSPDSPPWWPTVRNHHEAEPRLGLEADLLGWDPAGRLLVIEVKPADAVEGIAWAPAQARMYAEMFALWLDTDPHARSSLVEMAAQRASLGLPAPASQLPAQPAMRVVPVIAIGHGSRSPQALTRLAQVHTALEALPAHSPRLDPLEVWHVDDQGERQHQWRPSFDGAPS